MALYDATGGVNWTTKTNWKTNVSVSTWHGVTVSNGRVARLSLNSNNLSGTLPAALGNLTGLVALVLSNNDLDGEIPPELGNLASLTHLYLHGNQLTGSVPPQLGNLANLTVLNLGGNQLTGSIPPQLGNLANLTVLNLGGNQLAGSILPQLGNLASLTHLYLNGNQLTGSIPPQLGNLANLTVLNLSRNEGLTGPLPNSLRHLSKLEILNASGTDLHAPSDPAFQAWLASITYNGVPPKAEVPTLDFAHFANGSSWITDLVFVNLETQPSGPPLSPIVYFYGTNGESLAPESVVDIMGDLEVTEDSGLTVRTAMAPLAVLTISTHGRGDLITGSVRVVSDGLLGGMLRFAHPGIGEAVVGASLPSSDAIFPVRRQEGGITTAVAIHNLESSPELVRCDLKREGVLLDSVMIPLEANGQTSWSLETAFPAPDTSAFLGSVRCVAVGEGLFTAIALEMDPTTRTFITLPVMSVPEMPSPE